MTNVTYIYSRLLLGFLVISTSSYSALIQAASQILTTLSANSRLIPTHACWAAEAWRCTNSSNSGSACTSP